MIKARFFDIGSILLLSFLIIFSIVCVSVALINSDIFLFYISFSLIIIFMLLQFYIYHVSKINVFIDTEGLYFENKNDEVVILWDEILEYKYANNWFFLEPNSLEVFYKKLDKTLKLEISKKPSTILHISRKNYIKSLNLIPKYILNNNKYLIYNDKDLNKDKYNLYK